jgi:hypothetical protein
MKPEYPASIDVYQDEHMYWLYPIFAAGQPSTGLECLVISRPYGSVSLSKERRPPTLSFAFTICGLLGIINLHAGITMN